MILIGQYDSSFVRRIGIALRLYDITFEHRPWSVFGDGSQIQAINPLMRVPTLVLDDGDVIVDSASIIDHIDGLVPPAARLLPQDEPERRRAMRVVALATGLADKAVSSFYEMRLHAEPSAIWMERCRSQMLAVLAVLEQSRVAAGDSGFGNRIGHADIAVACAIRHTRESHPDLIMESAYPALSAHCAALEALPVFQEISQPFIPPT